MSADPAEPEQSHPLSPDHALPGCDGAGTACPKLVEMVSVSYTKKPRQLWITRDFASEISMIYCHYTGL